ncbi:MAG TPA: hypothetical protein VL463_10385 [Kofleriaceae bacterium]|nr:hypothetical protein [Kofleriaceae bacterium]
MQRLVAAVFASLIVAPNVYAGAVAHKPMHHQVGEVDFELESRAAPRRPTPPPPPPPRRELVKKALVKARAKHLAALHKYRDKGVFAHSLDRAGEVYVWRDADGHLDAVAAMMAMETKDQANLVVALSSQLNGVHLIEYNDGTVMPWMLTSGFSLDELDRIQRPHTRPAVVREGDTAWQVEEDERLAKSYGAVESYLKSHADDGLEAATDALMLRSELAWKAIGRTPPRTAR